MSIPQDTDWTPPEGFEGNLSDEQSDHLKEMWKQFFKLVKEEGEVAGVKADENADADQGDDGGEGEDAFKGKAKDDAAKDQQAKEKEKKEMAAMLGAHGAKGFHEAFWKAVRGETPDAFMLRYLRARKWDHERGFAMLAASLKWRIEQGVEEIKEKGEAGLCEEEGFRLQYDIGKSYIQGTDKNDRPIVFIHVAKHHPKDQSQKSLERFTIFNMETAKCLMSPKACSQGTLVFDLTNFGLGNMDWQCVKFILECFEARYPETLGLCIVHKAPMVFNAIWSILKPIMDPVVRSKIDFTKNESDLAKHIDPKHLKKAMGGELNWEWSYGGPAEGENDRMKDEEAKKEAQKNWDDAVKEFEETTEAWVNGDSNAGKDRSDRLRKLIIIRNLDLDPYVRGQTVYSRTGTNVGDGTVKWKYDEGEEAFGQSMDKYREELGIPGKCPRNGHVGGPVAAAQQAVDNAPDPDEAAAVAAGKAGGGTLPKLKRRASQSISKVTPGPSDSEKARTDAVQQKEKAEKQLEQAKQEQAKKDEEEKKKREEEQAEQEKNTGGMLNTITGTIRSAVAGTGGMALTGANMASKGVPSALGGDKLAEMTSQEQPKADGEKA